MGVTIGQDGVTHQPLPYVVVVQIHVAATMVTRELRGVVAYSAYEACLQATYAAAFESGGAPARVVIVSIAPDLPALQASSRERSRSILTDKFMAHQRRPDGDQSR